MSLVTVIGRGHSGTRAISHTLYASGVFMGKTLNPSGDKVPPQAMYDACCVMGKYVKWTGGLSWDFTALHTMQIDSKFETLIKAYLADVLDNKSKYRGWKIPETTLVYPWIVRMFPEVKYIHWIRDPRDCVLSAHGTDDLDRFGVESPSIDDLRKQRAISWLYQYELVQSTPKPKDYIRIRFEDFVLRQEETLGQLEDFLDIPLARIVVSPDAVGRWKKDTGRHFFAFLADAMRENHYSEND